MSWQPLPTPLAWWMHARVPAIAWRWLHVLMWLLEVPRTAAPTSRRRPPPLRRPHNHRHPISCYSTCIPFHSILSYLCVRVCASQVPLPALFLAPSATLGGRDAALAGDPKQASPIADDPLFRTGAYTGKGQNKPRGAERTPDDAWSTHRLATVGMDVRDSFEDVCLLRRALWNRRHILL